MNPFEEVKKLITQTWIDKIESPFMVNRILSTSPETFLTSVKINQAMRNIPKKEIIALFNLMVQKRNRNPYFNYPKKDKKQSPKLLEKICYNFTVNEFHAKQILKIIESKGIQPETLFGLKKGE